LTERFENNISQDSGVRHPLHDPMFLVQRHYRIRPNIFILALKMVQPIQSCRRLDSTSFLSSLLMILLNSISRASLRRSSFGLTRKGYRTPSVPRTVIFLGFCIEFMTSTSSSNATVSRFKRIARTLQSRLIRRERIVFFALWSVGRGKNYGKIRLKGYNDRTREDVVSRKSKSFA
jgi:hypothetical protein